MIFQIILTALIVNSGKEENIKLDMPVSGSNGIIGRISHVGERLSRVLLISNINSRIPVIISEDSYHGMLIGPVSYTHLTLPTIVSV